MHARDRSSLTMILTSLAFACWSALAIAPARAGLMIEVQNFATIADGTGTFDLVLVNDGPASFHVSADFVEIAITGMTGAVFTGATTATASTYIYVTSFADEFGISLVAGTPGTSLAVLDTEFADPLYRVLAPDESYGLAHVSFQDDPNAPLAAGMISVALAGTTFSDEDGNIIFPAVVPEPSSLVLLSLGSLVAMGSVRRPRKRAGRGSARRLSRSYSPV